MKLVSGSYWQRVGLYPMMLSLGLGWFFVFVWLAVCFWTFQFNRFWSLTICCSTLLFACFLTGMTRKMFLDAYREYTFELTDHEAILSVWDKLKKHRTTRMVLLDDIKYAEYYPYRDSASVIFHAPYADMEVPLWPMGERGQDVIDFLDGRGVHVINVQSDEKIPD